MAEPVVVRVVYRDHWVPPELDENQGYAYEWVGVGTVHPGSWLRVPIPGGFRLAMVVGFDRGPFSVGVELTKVYHQFFWPPEMVATLRAGDIPNKPRTPQP